MDRAKKREHRYQRYELFITERDITTSIGRRGIGPAYEDVRTLQDTLASLSQDEPHMKALEILTRWFETEKNEQDALLSHAREHTKIEMTSVVLDFEHHAYRNELERAKERITIPSESQLLLVCRGGTALAVQEIAADLAREAIVHTQHTTETGPNTSLEIVAFAIRERA